MTTPAPYSSGDNTSFACKTIHERLPAIFEQIIKDLQDTAATSDAPKKAEADKIVEKVRGMITDFASNAEITPIKVIHPSDQQFNDELESLAPVHYHNAPWLFYECYVYRKVQEFFYESTYWDSYDIFGIQKDSTFAKSEKAVGDLSARFIDLEGQIAEVQQKPLSEQLEVLKVLFHEAVLTSLWGNATDLSLLVTIDIEQIKKLQVASAERDKEAILANDFEKVWKQVRSSMGGRIDIVLDNAGFEFFTDLILALFLLDTGLAEQIVFHPKNIPWFVSDVTPRDWLRTTFLMNDKEAFPTNREAIDKLIQKIAEYQSAGQIIMRPSAYWTLGGSFWGITKDGKYGGDKVWEDFRASKLVIFKGDLNYRKLTGDVAWPRDTPFTEAIQGLASNGIPMTTFRTIKSDVVVGLPKGRAEELDEIWSKTHSPSHGWAWGGDYALIQYSK